MTVRVERSFELSTSPENVWSFLADPANRASAIDVVVDYEHREGSDEIVWMVELPIPLLNRSVSVYTEDVTVEAPNYVEFRGRSKIMHVHGEHRIEQTDEGCRVDSVFTVDGRIPGVEQYFKRHFDDELSNLETAMRADLELEV